MNRYPMRNSQRHIPKHSLGRGGGGQVFWVDRIAPSKKLKPPRSGKIFVTRGSCKKLLWGASPIMPPPPCRKRDPPPHTEKMAWPPRTWREKTAHIKIPPYGKLPPPRWIFLFMFPPPGERLYPPLRAPIMIYDLHSLCSVCLRELEKKNQQKLNKNKNFFVLSFNFLVGRCLDCIKYSEF